VSILNKLTIKHLKMNKKRTLVTIIGIILSTALMVGIGLLVSSVMTTQRLEAEKNWGSHHAKFTNLDEKEISTISKNININNIYYYAPLGFARIDNENPAKPYLYVVEGSTKLLDNLNLITGRLPSNDNEIIISEHLISGGKSKIRVGDTITLDIGVRYNAEDDLLDIAHNYSLPGSWSESGLTYINEELKEVTTKTYNIVGIASKTYFENYSDAGYMVFSLNKNPKNIYNAFVEFKNPRKTFDYISDISKSLNGISSEANTNLLYYYGATKYANVNESLMPLVIIALSVISIGCIIVIYNSFAISTMERKKSFGLYASIGATHKQIRSSVFFEAFIVGTIGIIIGVLGAFVGIYIVLEIINNLLKDAFNNPFIFSVDPLYLSIPLIFMILVIFISAYLPAKRSSKVSPIEAIRGNDDIKISKREVKTPKYIRKLFGIEGEIAHKNIKRNKKKYRITIISLFISIVMFNTFTSYLNYIVKATDTFDYYDYDGTFDLMGSKDSINSDISLIKSKYNLKDSLTIIDRFSLTPLNITPNYYTEEYLEYFKENYETPIEEITKDRGFMVLVIKDEDYRKITNKEAVILNEKYLTTYSEDTRKTTELNLFKKSDYNIEFNYETKDITINLNATIIDNVWGLKHTKYEVLPVILISESTYQEKIGYDENESMGASFIVNTEDYNEINKDLENKKTIFSSTAHFSSPKLEMANTKNLVLTIKILFYGFIALVTLIGVTSVINTINTNINLRRKEFAMLRSIGLSPKGFNKLLFFESLFFGLKSLIYGIPVSLGINILISSSIGNIMDVGLIINYKSLLISIIAVFLIVLLSMNYASKKIKKENILEALREENI